MLDVNNIRKVFAVGTPNENVALDDFSLHVDDGEFVTIVGSNGAGKSTLFNAVCGNFTIDRGSIELDGKDITYMPEHKRSKMIGRVFQDPMKGTAPNLTIAENVALAYSRTGLFPFGLALNRRDKAKFREALASFDMGLEDRMDTKVGLLSGGQRQVVTLLMCTFVTPKLLLLDEHTAALDPATSEKVMQITNDVVTKNKITTLMITHNLNSALHTGSKTIMMNSGKIVVDISGEERARMEIGDMLELYKKANNEALDNDRMLLS
ncbi:MAG: ATP-binding cassette domain-containing protein [Clostridia bacterium]|nr:ATP-binding cassette domain-containing protein [Clostridia bacterium]